MRTLHSVEALFYQSTVTVHLNEGDITPLAFDIIAKNLGVNNGKQAEKIALPKLCLQCHHSPYLDC